MQEFRVPQVQPDLKVQRETSVRLAQRAQWDLKVQKATRALTGQPDRRARKAIPVRPVQ